VTSAPAPEREPERYRPLLSFERQGFSLEIPVLVGGRAEGVSDVVVDRYGNQFRAGAVLSPLLRLGVRLETTKPIAGKLLILAEYEHDLPTGSWSSVTPLEGAQMPNAAPVTTELRKAWARFSLGPYLHVGGGFMTSHWGLGLVANDGAHGWEPGSARFTDPRGGDLSIRAFVGTGPLTSARVVATLAVEEVRKDDVLLPGDSAMQFIASALAGYGGPTEGGFFLVHRRQRALDGGVLNVTAVDVAGKTTWPVGPALLTLEGEGALITGGTTFGATPRIPHHDVRQLGAVVRTSLAFRKAGAVLDLVYASGDQNNDDSRVTGFKADPNFETGLLLFRYMVAAQTGRGYVTATDPQLVGAPVNGVERTPTRGAVTNALVVFPRLWVRPVKGLEAYAGALFAFAPVKNVDPFNTQLAGGTPRNALDQAPGSYWGTEIDLGLRYRVHLRGTELNAGAECGVLQPGSALRGSTGPDARVFGGRLMLGYRL
jgi:hypothetical protein